jgi:hypothetical protein
VTRSGDINRLLNPQAARSGHDDVMAVAGADEPWTAAQVAAVTARQALAAAVRRSLSRPGSVPPAEQDRLIAAERRAEQAGAEYPASALDSDRGPVR